jgi:site-specific recombinase XerC
VDKDKTPHSARHGMGVYIMEKTSNVAAVQRQLGHKNASFSSKLIVVFQILSSEYQLYTCGEIMQMSGFLSKTLIFQGTI